MLAPAAIPDRFDAMPDDQLMPAYAGGDAGAFDVLYARHETALFRFVRRLLGMRLASEVDEVFQATWTRIMSARDSFSPAGGSWRVWAFTIAHNLAIDRLRISGRDGSFYAHDEDGDGLDAAQLFSRGLLRGGSSGGDVAQPSAEELAFWYAAGRRLLACLDELPDDQRAAFLLHAEEGFTEEVMASVLDVGVETVRSRLRQGVRKLRGCMERYLSMLGSRMGAASDHLNAKVDDLRDERLRRALAYAPDQNAVPDWRLRQAILRKAHDAVGATDPDTDSAELERAARPWWRRDGASGRRWGVACATAVLAASALVYWQRQPAPGPKPGAETATIAALPSPPAAPSAVLAPSVTPASAEPPLQQIVQPAPAEQIVPPPPPAPSPLPLAPTGPAPAMAPLLADSAPFPSIDLPPMPAAPAITAAIPAAPAVQARKPSPTVRTDETDPPTFAALSTWTRITINRRGGESRSLSRAEARELNALLGSAALSAVGPRPLGSTPEWRVSLERGAEPLAVFEIAGSQVRWREGKTPAGTGVPSGPALAALREALQVAVQPPPEAAVPSEPLRSP